MKKMHYLLLVLVLLILCGCDPKDNEDPAPQRLTGVEWVVHTEGELGLVQGDSAVIVSVDADGNKLVYTRLGYIFSSADGLNWVEIPAQNRETTFPENEIIYICDMAIDRQGRVWLATTIGLACFSGNRWDLFNSSNSPMATDWISCLFADNADRIWISASNHNQGGLTGLRLHRRTQPCPAVLFARSTLTPATWHGWERTTDWRGSMEKTGRFMIPPTPR